ncbi:hypothetical protein L6164_017524 [Bauhinia variegata]|uniref:Uncharacterized protein n=1 Tax=Bauhinia variegata TaxID=167791 RepID=A0ACB9N8D8_BAUVA|nr:hypothetical protein L6164_017524 [Bauhinia variegata]
MKAADCTGFDHRKAGPTETHAEVSQTDMDVSALHGRISCLLFFCFPFICSVKCRQLVPQMERHVGGTELTLTNEKLVIKC